MKAEHPKKTCVSCGRTFTWRKSLNKNWDHVKYCSNACRTRKISNLDKRIERKILELLETQPHKTQISTKEIAKAVRDKDDKNLFEPIKRAARRLESTNSIIITQKGKKVDSSKAKGHLQIRKHHGNPRPN